MSLLEAQQPSSPHYAKREYLSYSTLLSFARCPRRYFYQKSGIYPHEESPALSFGSAMHKAVELASSEGLDAAVKAFSSVWDESAADEKRSLKRAILQLSHFVHTHKDKRSIYELLPPPRNDSIKLEDDVGPFEIPFVLDIGLPIPLAGRLDGWCQHRDTGEYWGYEFKTSSRLSSAMFDCLELNPQILSYVLVLRSLTNKPIRGIMFEAMLIDPKKVDNLTHPVLVQEHLVDDILLWLRYQGELLLECERRYEKLVEDGRDIGIVDRQAMEKLIDSAAHSFPKNFAGCSSYPHFYIPGSHCEYENLCRVPQWQTMLPYYELRAEHRMISLTTGAT